MVTLGWFAPLTKHGHATSTVTFDRDGHRVCRRGATYAKVALDYDDRGNVVHGAYFGTDNKPVLFRGTASWDVVYDDRGNRIQESVHDAQGQPTLIPSGFFRMTHVYDDQGNAIQEAYFGIDGQPMLCRGGYARLTRVYDARATGWKSHSVESMIG